MNTKGNIQDKSNFYSPLEFIRPLTEVRGNLFDVTPMILVGMGTCGIGNGADLVYDRVQKHIDETNAVCTLKKTGCFGFCAEEPLLTLYQPGRPMLVYSKVDEKDAVRIVDGLLKGKIYQKKLLCRIDAWDFHKVKIEFGKGYENIPHWDEIPFFKGKLR